MRGRSPPPHAATPKPRASEARLRDTFVRRAGVMPPGSGRRRCRPNSTVCRAVDVCRRPGWRPGNGVNPGRSRGRPGRECGRRCRGRARATPWARMHRANSSPRVATCCSWAWSGPAPPLGRRGRQECRRPGTANRSPRAAGRSPWGLRCCRGRGSRPRRGSACTGKRTAPGRSGGSPVLGDRGEPEGCELPLQAAAKRMSACRGGWTGQ